MFLRNIREDNSFHQINHSLSAEVGTPVPCSGVVLLSLVFFVFDSWSVDWRRFGSVIGHLNADEDFSYLIIQSCFCKSTRNYYHCWKFFFAYLNKSFCFCVCVSYERALFAVVIFLDNNVIFNSYCIRNYFSGQKTHTF
jgi:hypothetical protein